MKCFSATTLATFQLPLREVTVDGFAHKFISTISEFKGISIVFYPVKVWKFLTSELSGIQYDMLI